MKFGVREIANVVFRAKSNVTIGSTTFKEGQPVLYLDSATTSTLEGAATTVYAQGGRGNTRLIAWEGEKTLTFTVEDALLSPIGFSILSGAGLIKKANTKVNVHTTCYATITPTVVADSSPSEYEFTINLGDAIGTTGEICANAPTYVSLTESDGSITGVYVEGLAVDATDKYKLTTSDGTLSDGTDLGTTTRTVFCDFYIVKDSANVSEIQIDAENFAGYYYVEADTLFRRQDTGVDMPANITLPNVKIQSNFTFSMAATGDPSTFTFTMDAMPGYTYFDKTKKVLCVIQAVEDTEGSTTNWDSVMKHSIGENVVDTSLKTSANTAFEDSVED